MNVLLLSARFPWPPYTGDRLRARIWLSALEERANVALVSPAGRVPHDAPRFRFHPANRSATHAIAGAARVLRGAPLQSLLAAPYDWPEAIDRAGRDLGGFDATVVLLSRLDACVRPHLPGGRRVLDAVDSLRRSMAERAKESSPLTRWLWRAEERRVARVESEASRVYDRVVVVGDEDRDELGAIAISNGVAIAPLHDASREFDFGFWGRLPYFANADAATWLLDEIWPAIRAERPDATLVIGGADAPRRILDAHGRDGVTVESPVRDIATFARRVKVALFPVRYGSGVSNKVLEAAEAGCAIVATAKAMRGLDALHAHASIADETHAIARAAVAAVPQRALRAAVSAHYARHETLAQLAALVHEREAVA